MSPSPDCIPAANPATTLAPPSSGGRLRSGPCFAGETGPNPDTQSFLERNQFCTDCHSDFMPSHRLRSSALRAPSSSRPRLPRARSTRPGRPFMNDTTLLMPDDTPLLIFDHALEIVPRTAFHAEDARFLTTFHPALNSDFTRFNPLRSTLAIPTLMNTWNAPLSMFHTPDAIFLMPSHAFDQSPVKMPVNTSRMPLMVSSAPEMNVIAPEKAFSSDPPIVSISHDRIGRTASKKLRNDGSSVSDSRVPICDIAGISRSMNRRP